MMQLLENPTTHFLLQTSLDQIHKQSVKWLNEILFYSNEIDFFYTLIKGKKNIVIPISVENSIWHIEKELLKISGKELVELQISIREHEHFLRIQLTNERQNEEQYREKHLELESDFHKFQKRYISFKRKIFELVEEINNTEAISNQVVKTIFERRAIRKYSDKPVSKNLIKKIIQAGTMAPSATNKQPWKFYILTNPKTISEFSKSIATTAISESSKSALNLFNFPESEDIEEYSDLIFYKAPVVIFITGTKDDEWSELDIGMCVQNMILTAKSFGLGSCPVGFGRYVEKSSVFKKLKVAKNERVIISAIFGFAAEQPLAHVRLKNNVFFID